MLLNLFCKKNGKCKNALNNFYKACTMLIPKENRYTKNKIKLQAHLLCESKFKIHSKILNSRSLHKAHSLWLSWFQSTDVSLVQHMELHKGDSAHKWNKRPK